MYLEGLASTLYLDNNNNDNVIIDFICGAGD
jgi:hypothetical protein